MSSICSKKHYFEENEFHLKSAFLFILPLFVVVVVVVFAFREQFWHEIRRRPENADLTTKILRQLLHKDRPFYIN